MLVVKRDGKKESFNNKKIRDAVKASLLSVDYPQKDLDETLTTIVSNVQDSIPETAEISVEEVHRQVENELMRLKRTRPAARSYIEYRHDRDKAREGKGKLYADITGFLDQSAEEFTRENANKPSTVVNTHRDLLAGILSKHVALTQILPKEIADWHTEGFGHIHK